MQLCWRSIASVLLREDRFCAKGWKRALYCRQVKKYWHYQRCGTKRAEASPLPVNDTSEWGCVGWPQQTLSQSLRHAWRPPGRKSKAYECCLTTQEKVKQQLLTLYTGCSAAVKNRPPSSRWRKNCVWWADKHFPSSWSQCSQTYSQKRLLRAEPTYHEQVVTSHILQCSTSLKNQGFSWQAPPMVTVPAVQQDAPTTADLTPSIPAPRRKIHTVISFEFSRLLFYIFLGKQTHQNEHPRNGMLGDCINTWTFHTGALQTRWLLKLSQICFKYPQALLQFIFPFPFFFF